jgi:hypothetical protein
MTKKKNRKSRKFGPFSRKKKSPRKISSPYNVKKFDDNKYIPFIPSDKYIPLESYIKPISFRKRSFGRPVISNVRNVDENIEKASKNYSNFYDDKEICKRLLDKFIYRKEGTTFKDFINEYPAASRCTSLWQPYITDNNDNDYGMIKLSQ